MKRSFLLLGLLVSFWALVMLRLDYPPTVDVLKWGNLWPIVLVILIGLTVFMGKLVAGKLGLWVVWLWWLSPAWWVSVFYYPLQATKLLLMIVAWWGYVSSKRSVFYVSTGLWLALVIWVSWGRWPLWEMRPTSQLSDQVTLRFTREDELRENFRLPLPIRRMVNNKVVLWWQEFGKSLVTVFNGEGLFFQEIHPLASKDLPIFYWPEWVLFWMGMGVMLWKKKIIKPGWGWLWLMATANFFLTSGSDNTRLLLFLVPGAIVIAQIFEVRGIAKNLALLVLTLSLLIFGEDILARPDYWLDNRPLVYRYWFEEMRKMEVDHYEQIKMSSLLGNGEGYCQQMYPEICHKITHDSFALGGSWGESRTLYLGFAGEFIGTNFYNQFESNWKGRLPENTKIWGTMKVRDSIANRYGNEVLVVSFDE